MAIKAITIDFWNTLYDSRGGEGRDKERFQTILDNAVRLGHSLEPERVKASQKAAWEYFNRVWREERRTPPTRAMVEFFWRALEIPADERAIEEVTLAFQEGILRHPPALLPHALETVRDLAERHYIALISDTAFSPGRILRQIMERDGIAAYFSAWSFSDETGVSKPHETAYATALRGAGDDCAPHRCVHIGDIERTDIAGAKKFGMRAILFAGDPNGRMNDEHKDQPTEADARAESWCEIPDIVQNFR
jgi:putative hydrolase of the HAD superfamily